MKYCYVVCSTSIYMSIKSTQLLAKNTMECAFVWFIQCGKFPWQEMNVKKLSKLKKLLLLLFFNVIVYESL
jgi:hypothetical protein